MADSSGLMKVVLIGGAASSGAPAAGAATGSTATGSRATGSTATSSTSDTTIAGFDLSSIPWWGWAIGAGVAIFAMRGK
jgi:hypothetical protein